MEKKKKYITQDAIKYKLLSYIKDDVLRYNPTNYLIVITL